ncbi:MAG: phosphotyrosine protein phosphatase [Pikeienuella sp.]
MRSPTAADLTHALNLADADFAGLSNDADERLSIEHIEWADTILVMETRQKKRLTALFGPALKDKKVRVLNIPDKFAYGDDDLVALLRPKLLALF